METDILIVGGGAAGLAAAYETASNGLKVTLVEQSWSLGGHLREQIQPLYHLPGKFNGLRGFELADRLINQLEVYPIQFLTNHILIGRYKDGSFGVSDGANIFPVKASKVILTTGAAERPIAFPKWTLPGIMTAGAAQIFMNREKVKPGHEVIIVGSSDYALEICFQLREIGANIKGIIERKNTLQAKNKKSLELIDALKIPVFLQSEIETAMGKEAVEMVIVKKLEESLEIEVDLVCTDGGFTPAIEPFQMIDCAISYTNPLGGWLPDYDYDFRISEENIHVAGNAAGITCHGAVILSGSIAGMSVAESFVSDSELSSRKQKAWRELEDIETDYNPDIWNARLQHMNKTITYVI